jgi:hypothetical protein
MVARLARMAAMHVEEKGDMPIMDCPNCDGTRYARDAAGEQIICPVRERAASCSTTRVTLGRTLTDA